MATGMGGGVFETSCPVGQVPQRRLITRKVVGHLQQSNCDRAVREDGGVRRVVDDSRQRAGEGIPRRRRQNNWKALSVKIRARFDAYCDSRLEKGSFCK